MLQSETSIQPVERVFLAAQCVLLLCPFLKRLKLAIGTDYEALKWVLNLVDAISKRGRRRPTHLNQNSISCIELV